MKGNHNHRQGVCITDGGEGPAAGNGHVEAEAKQRSRGHPSCHQSDLESIEVNLAEEPSAQQILGGEVASQQNARTLDPARYPDEQQERAANWAKRRSSSNVAEWTALAINRVHYGWNRTAGSRREAMLADLHAKRQTRGGREGLRSMSKGKQSAPKMLNPGFRRMAQKPGKTSREDEAQEAPVGPTGCSLQVQDRLLLENGEEIRTYTRRAKRKDSLTPPEQLSHEDQHRNGEEGNASTDGDGDGAAHLQSDSGMTQVTVLLSDAVTRAEVEGEVTCRRVEPERASLVRRQLRPRSSLSASTPSSPALRASGEAPTGELRVRRGPDRPGRPALSAAYALALRRQGQVLSRSECRSRLGIGSRSRIGIGIGSRRGSGSGSGGNLSQRAQDAAKGTGDAEHIVVYTRRAKRQARDEDELLLRKPGQALSLPLSLLLQKQKKKRKKPEELTGHHAEHAEHPAGGSRSSGGFSASYSVRVVSGGARVPSEEAVEVVEVVEVPVVLHIGDELESVPAPGGSSHKKARRTPGTQKAPEAYSYAALASSSAGESGARSPGGPKGEPRGPPHRGQDAAARAKKAPQGDQAPFGDLGKGVQSAGQAGPQVGAQEEGLKEAQRPGHRGAQELPGGADVGAGADAGDGGHMSSARQDAARLRRSFRRAMAVTAIRRNTLETQPPGRVAEIDDMLTGESKERAKAEEHEQRAKQEHPGAAKVRSISTSNRDRSSGKKEKRGGRLLSEAAAGAAAGAASGAAAGAAAGASQLRAREKEPKRKAVEDLAGGAPRLSLLSPVDGLQSERNRAGAAGDRRDRRAKGSNGAASKQNRDFVKEKSVLSSRSDKEAAAEDEHAAGDEVAAGEDALPGGGKKGEGEGDAVELDFASLLLDLASSETAPAPAPASGSASVGHWGSAGRATGSLGALRVGGAAAASRKRDRAKGGHKRGQREWRLPAAGRVRTTPLNSAERNLARAKAASGKVPAGSRMASAHDGGQASEGEGEQQAGQLQTATRPPARAAGKPASLPASPAPAHAPEPGRAATPTFPLSKATSKLSRGGLAAAAREVEDRGGVDGWLWHIGLSAYASIFRKHGIDSLVLPLLAWEDLVHMGVPTMRVREKLHKAICELQRLHASDLAEGARTCVRAAAEQPEDRRLELERVALDCVRLCD
eukprot:jgi/Mesen1/4985/ME000248S04275